MANRATVAVLFVVIIGTLMHSSVAFAAADDVVQLKDGSSIKGTVIKQDPGRYVTIRDEGGREVTLSYDDVKRVDISSDSAESSKTNPTATTQRVDKDSLGLVMHTTFTNAEERRQEWKRRGGTLVTYDLHGSATFIVIGNLAKLGKKQHWRGRWRGNRRQGWNHSSRHA